MAVDVNLRLGLIGLSEGNGHPYSWAAICNGYTPCEMSKCEFPAIPQYLAKQAWPESRLPGVEVSHVWTQDLQLSHRVAAASNIKNVVLNPSDMIGEIDGLLLARDDAENHLEFAADFLRSGIPVYIDKPIALSNGALEALYDLELFDGQIFTCSALRYAREFMLSDSDREDIGSIRHIRATAPNQWERYAVHIIEPTLNLVASQLDSVYVHNTFHSESLCNVSAKFKNGITADFSTFGPEIKAPLSLRIHGEKSWTDLVFRDSFSCFKSALADFLEGIRLKDCRSPIEFNRQVVSIISAGL